MKDHSQFRAFQLNYDVTANNVALFYEQSSLDISWNGLNSASIFGILLFHKFSHVTNMLHLLDPQNLDVNLIQNLLNNTSITQSLNVQNKKFYLHLLADTKFYLDQISKVSIFSLGPFFEVQIE
jgi:hypothetical protein